MRTDKFDYDFDTFFALIFNDLLLSDIVKKKTQTQLMTLPIILVTSQLRYFVPVFW